MKQTILSILTTLLIGFFIFYIYLPPINITSIAFWLFVIVLLFVYGVASLIFSKRDYKIINISSVNINVPKSAYIVFTSVLIIVAGILLINFVCSPLFNAKSYSKRITIDESNNFLEDVKEVDFKSIPLLDRDSSQKLGDRVMGQMNEYVSQYYVSDQYTQINFNNEILRVTPLEYDGFIKWIANRKNGINAYITVNSVNGEAKLTKLDKGMRYMPSALFNEKLTRKLRFLYPTTILGDSKFEIDNEGTPYWITPTYKYTGINMKTKVTGVVILNPVTGDAKKYNIDEIPSWVDNAYNASLIIEQVDDWGTYKNGFLNSIFGQKNVVNTTEGYNYLALNDDIYLYTGITSVLSDESNLGFILSNMRTGKTTYYPVAGAEEYSAMASAEGQVQQMGYESTFPLLINLNNRPTYLVSLKDAAGLVKMYGFVDVEDYQKVVVTDAAKGIEVSAQNYLSSFGTEVGDNLLEKTSIIVKKITSVTIDGNTYFYIIDENNKKYKVSIKTSDSLPYVTIGDKLEIGYVNKNKNEIIEITKVY